MHPSSTLFTETSHLKETLTTSSTRSKISSKNSKGTGKIYNTIDLMLINDYIVLALGTTEEISSGRLTDSIADSNK